MSKTWRPPAGPWDVARQFWGWSVLKLARSHRKNTQSFMLIAVHDAISKDSREIVTKNPRWRRRCCRRHVGSSPIARAWETCPRSNLHQHRPVRFLYVTPKSRMLVKQAEHVTIGNSEHTDPPIMNNKNPECTRTQISCSMCKKLSDETLD